MGEPQKDGLQGLSAVEPAAPSSEQRGLQKQWVQGARGDTEMFKGKPSDNVKAPLGQLDT